MFKTYFLDLMLLCKRKNETEPIIERDGQTWERENRVISFSFGIIHENSRHSQINHQQPLRGNSNSNDIGGMAEASTSKQICIDVQHQFSEISVIFGDQNRQSGVVFFFSIFFYSWRGRRSFLLLSRGCGWIFWLIRT